MPGRQNKTGWLPAIWPAPAHIHAGTTTRAGGVSLAPYASFNLASHVGDNLASVEQNRALLCQNLCLGAAPSWLQQSHGNRIIEITGLCKNAQADGSYTRYKHLACAVLTADCLPLLLCDAQGAQISAVHIGWRGFSNNIITNAISRFTAPARELLAWMGPCISKQHYEVGPEVRAACAQITGDPAIGFTRTRNNHWFADLALLTRFQLVSCGVHNIYGGDYCTFAGKKEFYSYRRDGVTGRLASLIWME